MSRGLDWLVEKVDPRLRDVMMIAHATSDEPLLIKTLPDDAEESEEGGLLHCTSTAQLS